MTITALVFSLIVLCSLAVYIVCKIAWELKLVKDKRNRRIAISFLAVTFLLYVLPLFFETYYFGPDILKHEPIEILGKLCGATIAGFFIGALGGATPALIAIVVEFVIQNKSKPKAKMCSFQGVVSDVAVTAAFSVSCWVVTVRCFAAMIGVIEWSFFPY